MVRTIRADSPASRPNVLRLIASDTPFEGPLCDCSQGPVEPRLSTRVADVGRLGRRIDSATDAPPTAHRARDCRRSAVALAAAGCGGSEVTPTPETVIGTLPEDTGAAIEVPAGDAAAGAAVFESGGCGGCHVLSGGRNVGHRRPQPRRGAAVRREGVRADPERRRRNARLQGSTHRAADRRRDGVRRRVHLG